MRNNYKLSIIILILLLAGACTKYDSDVNLEENIEKQGKMNSLIRQRLADAPYGWLLLVPSLDTAVKTAIPVLMQFDTLKGTYSSKSPFPASASTVPTLYEINSATGAPLLSFATSSVFSGWYEAGGITDYYFKVLSVGTDTITIQPYRKGTVYASEGGVLMKMIRQAAPLTWFNNPVDLPGILTNNTSPLSNSMTNPLRLTYQSGYIQPDMNMEFDKHSAGNLNFIQTQVPFCRFLKPFPVFLFLNKNYNNPVVYYCGNNSLIVHFDNGFTPAAWFQTGPQNFSRAIKTDYLLVRSVSADKSKLELFAVDGNGKEIITGTLAVE